MDTTRWPARSARRLAPLLGDLPMPSASLVHWQTDRLARLGLVDAHCGSLLTSAAAAPARPSASPRSLVDESLEGYVMLLSGHFQGFCRDLYGECAQIFAAAVTANLRDAIQAQFAAELKLDAGNGTIENIRKDFQRFGIILDLAGAAPSGATWITHLGHLNYWRNAVAHQKPVTPPVGIPSLLTLANIRTWRAACDGLATTLDAILERELTLVFGFAPW